MLDAIGRVYQHELQTRELDPATRLAHHQQHSAPVMTGLLEWMDEQVRERLVEPNSRLGRALRYVKRHWDGLTCFLHVPGAPLDNNGAYAVPGIGLRATLVARLAEIRDTGATRSG